MEALKHKHNPVARNERICKKPTYKRHMEARWSCWNEAIHPWAQRRRAGLGPHAALHGPAWRGQDTAIVASDGNHVEDTELGGASEQSGDRAATQERPAFLRRWTKLTVHGRRAAPGRGETKNRDPLLNVLLEERAVEWQAKR